MSSNTFPTAFVALALGGLSLAALATSQATGGKTTFTPEDLVEDLTDEIADAPVSVCSLSIDSAGGGALLLATLEPDETLSGTFALRVTRSSGGNRSSIRQGGSFVALVGEKTVLSISSFNSMSGIEAQLTIEANGQILDCAYPAYPLTS